MAQSPLSFTPLANSLLLQSHFSFTYLETLLGVIGSRPPWPQVTCKLTSPFPSPPHSLPIPNSQHPRLIVRLTKMTSWSRLLTVRNSSNYPALDVLSWQSCPTVRSSLSFPDCPHLTVLSSLSSPGCPPRLSSSGSPVLAVLFFQSFSSCPHFLVLCINSTGIPQNSGIFTA
jgi:hypothetical protein